MMRLEKRIQELHREVGGEFNPFKLATFMGITISYNNEIGKVLGFYQPMQGKQININSSLNIEKQEDICLQLLTHYASNRDQELWITDDNFKVMMHNERIMSKLKQLVMNSTSSINILKIIKTYKQKSSLT
jgi:hypothetical protein